MVNKNDVGGLGIKNIPLMLLIATCLAGLLFGIVHLQGIISKSQKPLWRDYKKIYKFTDAENTAFLKNHKGLWQFNLQTMVGGKVFNKTDRLEIKENGMIWQVTVWNLVMPSESLITLCQIREALIKPYGIKKNDSLCDALIISQAFIIGTDTCFGAWYYPELWELHKNGSSLVFNRRQYVAYNGENRNFYPEGSVSYVYSAEKQFFNKNGAETNFYYPISIRKADSKTGFVKLVPIRDSLKNLYDHFKAEINRECSIYPVKKANSDTIAAFIGRYFDPYIISEKLRNFPRELPSQIKASFNVKTDGSVDGVLLTSTANIDKMLSEDLSKEIGSWRLPSSEKPIKVAYTFKMP